jgi:hypothetical protein
MNKPEIVYDRKSNGVITSCRVDGKFIRLRYWSDWCHLDAHLEKLGWKMHRVTRELRPIE